MVMGLVILLLLQQRHQCGSHDITRISTGDRQRLQGRPRLGQANNPFTVEVDDNPRRGGGALHPAQQQARLGDRQPGDLAAALHLPPRLRRSRGAAQPGRLAVRSRARPPLYFLFSRAGEHDGQARLPRSRSECNAGRIRHAVPLLDRVLDYAMGRVPVSRDVSEFCESAERAGAAATLIVCDANAEYDRYYELLMGLRSRGRRTVVVGSQYRSDLGTEGQNQAGIVAPARLSDDEEDRLTALVGRHVDISDRSISEPGHILSSLYRLLPASRPRIGAGLNREARTAAIELRSRGRQTRQVEPMTLLHQRLLDAGIVSRYQPLFDERGNELPDDSEDTVHLLIDFVMVAGSLDCLRPVNLLMRAVTGSAQDADLSMIAGLFRNLDLFRWRGAGREESEIYVGPRTTLEAEVLCRSIASPPLNEANSNCSNRAGHAVQTIDAAYSRHGGSLVGHGLASGAVLVEGAGLPFAARQGPIMVPSMRATRSARACTSARMAVASACRSRRTSATSARSSVRADASSAAKVSVRRTKRAATVSSYGILATRPSPAVRCSLTSTPSHPSREPSVGQSSALRGAGGGPPKLRRGFGLRLGEGTAHSCWHPGTPPASRGKLDCTAIIL